MNNPNPLVPQGSLLERQAGSKPHLRVAIFIVAVHLVFLGGLLMQGCKRDNQPDLADLATNDTTLAPLTADTPYTNDTSMTATGAPPTDVAALSNALYVPAVDTAPPAPVEPIPAASSEYVVAGGDNFTTIGKKFGLSANAIAKANPGVDSARLKIGQKLVIPAADARPVAGASSTGGSDTYIVKSGDNLSKIARAHGTTVAELKSLNGLKTDRINVGDKLTVPASAPAPAPATAEPTPAFPLPSAGTTNSGAPRTF